MTLLNSEDEERTEGKLTLTPHLSHQIQASFLDLERTRTDIGFTGVRKVDVASFNDNRQDPQEIQSGNNTGILSSSQRSVLGLPGQPSTRASGVPARAARSLAVLTLSRSARRSLHPTGAALRALGGALAISRGRSLDLRSRLELTHGTAAYARSSAKFLNDRFSVLIRRQRPAGTDRREPAARRARRPGPVLARLSITGARWQVNGHQQASQKAVQRFRPVLAHQLLVKLSKMLALSCRSLQIADTSGPGLRVEVLICSRP